MHKDIELLLKYFPDLTQHQIHQFSQLKRVYTKWNAQINVISRKDIDELQERHVLHSLSIAKFIQFNKGAQIMDLGCGGGFPGIPLAILFPEVSFTMIDSIGKKIKVVQAVVEELGINNVSAHHMRAEKVKGKFDFVITRAVAPMVELVKWTRSKFLKENVHSVANGIIALKGGDLNQELASWGNRKKVVSISEYYSEEFFETKKVVHVPVTTK